MNGNKTRFIEEELEERCKYIPICDYKASIGNYENICHGEFTICPYYKHYLAIDKDSEELLE